MLKGSCVLSLRPVPIPYEKKFAGRDWDPDCKVTGQQGCRAILDVARAFQLVRTEVKRSRDERFVQGGQSESNKVFDRAEATQRLSRSSRLRGRCMVSHAAHNAGLPVF